MRRLSSLNISIDRPFFDGAVGEEKGPLSSLGSHRYVLNDDENLIARRPGVADGKR